MSKPWRKCWVRTAVILVLLTVVLVGSADPDASGQIAPAKHVLVIHSYHQGFKWTDQMTQGITAALRDYGQPVLTHFEYMDTKRVSDPAYFQLLYAIYKLKYHGSRFETIIATDNDAFDFLKQYRDSLFPSTPVVFCGVNNFEMSQLEGKKLFTGVNEAADFKATLDLALRLHPATRRIIVINDETTTGRIVQKEMDMLIPAYKDRATFTSLGGLAMSDILSRVRQLGPDTLVFYGLFSRDGEGNFYEYNEGISLIAKSCPVPIYGVWDFYLGYGLTGGMLTSGYFQGETAGKLAVRVLRGEKVEDIPVVMSSPNRYMFDYQLLQHFHIATSALPRGSTIMNRPSSLVSVSRHVWWGGIAALICSGLIISFLVYNTAIRRRAERELRETAVRYRIVADNTYNWEFWLAPEGAFVYTSPSCQRITGHPAREFRTDPGLLQRLIHPDDWEQMAGHRHDVVEQKTPGELEFRILLGDGEIRWIHHVCCPVFDDNGRFLGTRASNSDITERKRAEERNLLLAGIVDSSDDAIFGETLDGTVTSWNKGAERIFGYSEGEMTGKPISVLVPLEHQEEVSEVYDIIKRGEHIDHFETVRARKDGTRIYLSLTYSPIMDDRGRVVAVSTVGRDITERKKAEDALRESEQKYRLLNQALDRRVKESVDELRQKDKILIIQGRQAIMGEMIGNIAHQWRQPLNMLGLLAQELQVMYRRGDVGREYIDTNVNKSMEIIRYMSKTIDDFRFFFAPAKEKVAFQLLEVIEKTISLLEAGFEALKIQTSLEPAEDLAVVGYPNEFSQVVLNILMNAKDAFVSRSIVEPRVSIGVYRHNDKAVVTITDNAGGIPEQIIDKIFEPYFTTKGPEQGSGVGLFMCKTIIEKNMDGILTVRNVADGAEFRIEMVVS